MLEQERQNIDRIDREIVRLFEERTRTVEQVAQVKLTNNLPVLDASREQLVIEKVQSYLTDPTLSEEIATLYTEIMRLSREHQTAWLAEHNQSLKPS